MKVALLLTGQLRSHDIVKYIQMNSVIQQYNTDVFMSIDLDNSLQHEHKNPHSRSNIDAANSAIAFFKPVDVFIYEQPPKSAASDHVIYRQYFVVKKAYELLCNHINNTGNQYDLIIRLRFDQILYPDDGYIREQLEKKDNRIIYNDTNRNILNTLSIDKKISFNDTSDNILYVFGFGDYKHYKYVNDQFFYHNSSLINAMLHFYDDIQELSTYCDANGIGNEGARIECIFYLYLVKKNIVFKWTQITGDFVRLLE